MISIKKYIPTIITIVIASAIILLLDRYYENKYDAVNRNGLEAIGTITSIEKGYRGKEFAYYSYKVDSTTFKSSHLGYTLTDSIVVGDKFLVKYMKNDPKNHIILLEKRIK